MVQPINGYQFVLYDTGQVICRHWTRPGFTEFSSVQLSPAGVARLLSDVGAVNLTGPDTFYDPVETASDVGVYSIEFVDPRTGTTHHTSIRGVFTDSGDWFFTGASGLPETLRRAFKVLLTFSNPHEQPWYPEYLNLTVRAAGGPSGCPWPQDWEDLSSAGSHRFAPARRDPPVKLGTIRANGTRLMEIQRFLESCLERTGSTTVLLRGESVDLELTVDLPHQVASR